MRLGSTPCSEDCNNTTSSHNLFGSRWPPKQPPGSTNHSAFESAHKKTIVFFFQKMEDY